jgi:hypothetical protein
VRGIIRGRPADHDVAVVVGPIIEPGFGLHGCP